MKINKENKKKYVRYMGDTHKCPICFTVNRADAKICIGCNTVLRK